MGVVDLVGGRPSIGELAVAGAQARAERAHAPWSRGRPFAVQSTGTGSLEEEVTVARGKADDDSSRVVVTDVLDDRLRVAEVERQ